MEKSLRLYIDTSVWNFALETERGDNVLTYDFLRLIKKENYDVIVSDTVMTEIEDAHEPRKSNLLELIEFFNCKIVQPSK